MEPIRGIVEAEKANPGLVISLSGDAVFLRQTEVFAQRIIWLFPLALAVICLLHYEAFRTMQGLILPIVTALMAVVWGTGIIGLLGQPLDIFNSTTPILILAISAGHAVQLLKRYYEEYERLARGGLAPAAANREAVVASLAKVGPVMIVAGGVAALGFLSLLVFDIKTIRTFGLYTAAGIASAVLLEMTFIPAVRSLLPAPVIAQPHGGKSRIWDRFPAAIAEQLLNSGRRRWLTLGVISFAVLCGLAATEIKVDNATKGFFPAFSALRKDDSSLNQQFAGTISLYMMVEGSGADSIKSVELLRAIEETQRFIERQPEVGKTVSIVDYLKRMNRGMHGDLVAEDRLPASSDLVSQFLLLYSMSGDPTDFDNLVDSDYRRAKITVLLKTESNAYTKLLVERLKAFATERFGPDVTLSFGGDVVQTIALTDAMVRGKLLNIIQIAVAVFAISSLAFRSFSAGLIVMSPLVVAVLGVFGAMGVFGIPLNIPNSLIAAMSVGIGADYAIYLLHRMREQVARGDTLESGIRTTMKTAGKAVLFVATAVGGGYSVLGLSIGYNIHFWLALFILISMVVSALVSLILVPSMVIYFRPAFIFKLAERRPIWQVAGLVGLMVMGSLFMVRLVHAEEPSTAKDIMRASENATRFADSTASATFTLQGADGGTRVRTTIGYTKLIGREGDEARSIQFKSPADIKGTTTLLVSHVGRDDDMWIYLPALGKVRRLNASNKHDSFVGTDFSFGDILGYKTDDWKHQVVSEEVVDGQPCHVIDSTPASDSVREAYGYSKRRSLVRKDNSLAVRTDYWGVDGRLAKRVTAKDWKQLGAGGRWQAFYTEAVNLQTGHSTKIRFDDVKVDQNLSDDKFLYRNLEN